ncbi:MAG: hypothetical protein NC095_06875 [Muribaculum sp.]|nr:hypothetical protein [Muribaculum sp.]
MDTTKQIPHSSSEVHTQQPAMEFNGFTLDEIRHHRALLSVRKEFAKAKVLEKVDNVKERNPFAGNSKMKAASRLGSLPLKLMKGLNYTDYILLGISTFGTLKKAFSFFRKKK